MIRLGAFVVALLLPVAVFAQTQPGPPGPYVIDLHGAMVGIPNAGEFYPTLPASATIPGRGFGLDVGAHVIGRRLGGARLGIGANLFLARGHVGPPDVSARVTAVAPQGSLNFGTSDGWSYLSGGYGLGRIATQVSGSTGVVAGAVAEATVASATDAETGMVGTLNLGGGARWFVKPRMAVGFDVRVYRFGASSQHGTPATMRTALSVGVSVR